MLSRVREEAAQGQTEYALLLAAIGLALLLMLLHFGGALRISTSGSSTTCQSEMEGYLQVSKCPPPVVGLVLQGRRRRKWNSTN